MSIRAIVNHSEGHGPLKNRVRANKPASQADTDDLKTQVIDVPNVQYNKTNEKNGLTPLATASLPLINQAIMIRRNQTQNSHKPYSHLQCPQNRESSSRFAAVNEQRTHQQLLTQLNRFYQQQLKSHDQQQVTHITHLLCFFLDEMISDQETMTAHNTKAASLQSIITGQHLGGTAFYQITQRALKQANKHLAELQIAHFCLALGFKGQYVHDAQQIERFRAAISHALFEQGVSTHTLIEPVCSKPVGFAPKRHRRYLLMMVASLLTMCLSFGYFNHRIASSHAHSAMITQDDASDSIVLLADQSDNQKSSDLRTADTQQRLLTDLQQALQQPISTQHIALLANKHDVKILVAMDDLFCYNAMPNTITQWLSSIGSTLANYSINTVTITGHTDSQPVKPSKLCPTNLELSATRADRVVASLSPQLPSHVTIRSRGLSDTVPPPKVTNNGTLQTDSGEGIISFTPRRVEITVHQP